MVRPTSRCGPRPRPLASQRRASARFQTLSQNATTQSSQTACFAGMRKIASLIVAQSPGGPRPHTDAIFFGNVGHVGIIHPMSSRCWPVVSKAMEMPHMVEQMTKESRDFLEAESLRVAKRVLGCKHLTAVKIARVHPPGSGPNWCPVEFKPPLPPMAEAEARKAIASLTGKYARLMGT